MSSKRVDSQRANVMKEESDHDMGDRLKPKSQVERLTEIVEYNRGAFSDNILTEDSEEYRKLKRIDNK